MQRAVRLITIKDMARAIGVSRWIAGKFVKAARVKGEVSVLSLSPSASPNSHRYLTTTDAVAISMQILQKAFDDSARTSIYKYARPLVK
jgi:hypothetical protein